ncbi:MAG: hypothetical protein HC800_08350 [Phormidesmis sp. RL_2_1]|nr:hypothetical protein [Phormidesmis sp. RL_2_1]
MKPTASNTSRQTLSQLAQRLNLGITLEETYGSGVLRADYKRAARSAGWSAPQLLAMSAAKSLYN